MRYSMQSLQKTMVYTMPLQLSVQYFYGTGVAFAFWVVITGRTSVGWLCGEHPLWQGEQGWCIEHVVRAIGAIVPVGSFP